jgi:hypothetical protein
MNIAVAVSRGRAHLPVLQSEKALAQRRPNSKIRLGSWPPHRASSSRPRANLNQYGWMRLNGAPFIKSVSVKSPRAPSVSSRPFDWGLANATADQGRDLLEILEDRHGRGSTIVTSQVDVKHWHEMIANPTVADAILDRLVHNAHRLNLAGESMRKGTTKRPTLDAKHST